MNNSDVTLSEQQNDVIHGVALKQLQSSRFQQDSDKATVVTSTSSSSRGPDMTATRPSEENVVPMKVEHEEHEDDEDEDDDMGVGVNPFSSLFERMAKPDKKRGQPTGGNGQQPAKKAKNVKASTGTGTSTTGYRNKHEKSNGSNVVGQVNLEKELGSDHVENLDQEDATMVQNYVAQLKELKHLNASGNGDEQSFGPWVRARMTKVAEVKSGIKAKKKALTRRKKDSTDFKAALDEVHEKLHNLSNFLKKLSSNGSEGRELYDDLSALVNEDDDYKPSSAICQRCIRGLAFEDSQSILQTECIVHMCDTCKCNFYKNITWIHDDNIIMNYSRSSV